MDGRRDTPAGENLCTMEIGTLQHDSKSMEEFRLQIALYDPCFWHFHMQDAMAIQRRRTRVIIRRRPRRLHPRPCLPRP